MSHPLDGPRFKIRRAVEEIDALAVDKETFRQSPSYEVIAAEINPHTGNQVYRVRIHGNAPVIEWGVRIGEIAHNLRSALDQLVWQLALLNTNTPAWNSQFPIFLIGKTKRRRAGRKTKTKLIRHFEADGRNMIRSLRPTHQAVLERLQPYKRGGGRLSPLYLLTEINNADKHRLIQVVAPRAGAIIAGGWEDAIGQVAFSGNLRKPLKDGAKLLEAPRDVHVQPNIVPSITFWKGCLAVKCRPVIATLRRIAEHVSQIVESFAPEFL